MRLRTNTTDPRSLTNLRIRALASGKTELIPIGGKRVTNPGEIEFIGAKRFIARSELPTRIRAKTKKTLGIDKRLEDFRKERANLQKEITDLKDEIKKTEEHNQWLLDQAQETALALEDERNYTSHIKYSLQLLIGFANYHKKCKPSKFKQMRKKIEDAEARFKAGFLMPEKFN